MHLIYLLVKQQPSLIPTYARPPTTRENGSFEDKNAWVALYKILRDILQDPALDCAYKVVDASDECKGDFPGLLDFIGQNSTSPRVKWVVSKSE